LAVVRDHDLKVFLAAATARSTSAPRQRGDDPMTFSQVAFAAWLF